MCQQQIVWLACVRSKVQSPAPNKAGVVAQVCHASSGEMEVGHPQQHSELEARLR